MVLKMEKILERIINRNNREFGELLSANSRAYGFKQTPSVVQYALMNPYEFYQHFPLPPNQRVTGINSHNYNEYYELSKEYQDSSGNTLLHYAAKLGNLALVKFLLQKNYFPVDQKNYSHTAPLKYAVEESHKEVALELLKAGADPNKASLDKNVIDYTANKEIKEILLEYGAVNSLNEDDGYIKNLYAAKIHGFRAKTITHSNIHSGCIEEENQIPHNIFYIWLTNPDNPKEAPLSHLAVVNSTISNFKPTTDYSDWNYQFYTNAPYSITNTTNFFTDLGFEVKAIKLEYSNFVTGSFIDLFIKANQFGIAADLARYELVNAKGGIYYDLNFNGTRALDHETCAYDFVNFSEEYGEIEAMVFLENSFFMAKANHPILQETINDIYKAYYGLNSKSEVFWQNINITNTDTTNILFSLFSNNNLLNLTSNSIIYNFYEDRFSINQTYVDNFRTCAADELESFPTVIKDIILADDYSFKGSCTNHHLIEPIGHDSFSESESWMER